MILHNCCDSELQVVIDKTGNNKRYVNPRVEIKCRISRRYVKLNNRKSKKRIKRKGPFTVTASAIYLLRCDIHYRLQHHSDEGKLGWGI